MSLQTSPEFSEDEGSSDDDSCSEADLHDAEDDLHTLDLRGGDSSSTQGEDELLPKASAETVSQAADDLTVTNGHNGVEQSNGEWHVAKGNVSQ